MTNPHRSSFLVATTLALSTVANAQQTLRSRTFNDKTNGYRIVIPKDWTRLPINVDEKWMVAHFTSKRQFFGNARKGDSGWGRKAVMKVIMFDADAIKNYVDVETDGKRTIKTFHRPYRHYKDYAKRNLGGGGYYYNEELAGTVGDVGVMKYQIKVEKLAHDRKRYIAWVYKGRGVNFAVEFEILEAKYKKLHRKVMAALGSFKFIERTAKKPGGDAKILGKDYTSKEWDELTVRERHSVRIRKDEAREKKMLARLPEAWKAVKTRHFLILSHTDKKYTNYVKKAAEVYHTWIEKRFGGLTDEYPMKIVIRICKNTEEYNAYHDTSSGTWGWSASNREIVDYDRRRYGFAYTSDLFTNIFRFYMYDKAPALFRRLPLWADLGLRSYVGTSMFSKRKIRFLRSIDEFVDFAHLRRMEKGSIKTAREIMHLDALGWFDPKKKQKDIRLGAQIATFYRWMEGPGRRHKLFKSSDFLHEYMLATLAQADKYDEKDGIEISHYKEATTEEEEEEQAEQSRARAKANNERAKARHAEFVAELHKTMCAWTDAEWESLDRAYRAYHKKKTR